MSLKSRLIEELGEEKAAEILSEQGRLMRSKVKKPYHHFSTPEAARKAQKKGVQKRREAKSIKEEEQVGESQS